MTDNNFWKKAYKDLWEKASTKEETLRIIIQKTTGLELEPFGLGAESIDFINGSAKENNNEKGAPDYHIKNTNIYVEVTGPVSDAAKPQNGLWIRPDKLNYAYKYLGKKDEFFVLYFPSVKEWYVLHFTEEFANHASDFKSIKPIIRGIQEKYIEIPYNCKYINSLDYLIKYLQK